MLPELTAIAFSFTSLHIPYDEQNYVNPGIHLEAENYRAGIYRNSNRRDDLAHTTAYVGYSVPLGGVQTWGIPIHFGALLALGSGYNSPIFGGLESRVGDRLVVLVAPYAGGDGGKPGAVLGFAYRIPIKW